MQIVEIVKDLLEALLSKEVAIALIAAYIGARATSKAALQSHELATQKSKREEV
ncbi:hypothetical protein [Pseudomonas sp. IzPS59]|uniref:hypothetical protein n=1 Tax=Pseudomonas sp. IzPS59 TaxID=2774459 RepID=UPI001787D694|nr:hypothetical protein [Pseudomonas sp. IzPS59]